MKQILDAILAGETSPEAYAALEIPDHYRAVTVHKDETEMFDGARHPRQGPAASPCTSRTSPCPSSAPARPTSR